MSSGGWYDHWKEERPLIFGFQDYGELMKSSNIPFKLTAIRLRQLQLFDLAALLGSISEAARQLNISQPAATEMLKGLERAFSVQLFIGTSRGIELTAEGKRVAIRASAALRELEFAVEDASGQLPVGEVLRIGLVPTAIYGKFTTAIRTFVEANPGVLMNIREMNGVDLIDALNDGTVDIAVAPHNPSFEAEGGRDQIVVHQLSIDRYEICRSAALELPLDWEPTPEALQRLSWILPYKQSFVRSLLDDWFLTRGIGPPQSYIEMTPMTTAMEMLRTFPYVALLPAAAIERGDFAHIVALQGRPLELPIRLVAAAKQYRHARPTVSAFFANLESVYGAN